MKTKPNSVIVGTGVLTWFGYERQSDRYGTVWLMQDGTEAPAPLTFPAFKPPGKLYAKVIEGRRSSHIGDLFRGLRQRQVPVEGYHVLLGEGFCFSDVHQGIKAIGTMPTKHRSEDWLNPRELYNLHNSVVQLIWEPGQ